jgi:hypothetical protein
MALVDDDHRAIPWIISAASATAWLVGSLLALWAFISSRRH